MGEKETTLQNIYRYEDHLVAFVFVCVVVMDENVMSEFLSKFKKDFEDFSTSNWK